MGHVTSSLEQTSFRGRNDDGNETTATWKAAVNTNFSQLADTRFRLRFLVPEVNGGSESNVLLQLQYNHNGGGWNDVTTSSSVVRPIASPNVANNADTTQQIGSGTYIAGSNNCFDESLGEAGGGNTDYAGNDECEFEFSIQLLAADVSNNDTIDFRLVESGGALLDAYTNPTVTALIPDLDQTHFRVRNDDGGETAATWIEPTNADATIAIGQSWRLRFGVEMQADVAETDGLDVEVQINGGLWDTPTQANSFGPRASTHYTNGDDTTQQITSGGNFVSPNEGMRRVTAQGPDNLAFTGINDIAELEFAWQTQLGFTALVHGDEVDFRLYRDGGGEGSLDTYTVIPRIFVTGFEQTAYRFRNDDDDEAAATWKAAVDTDVTVPLDEVFRLRFVVKEVGHANTAEAFKIQYNTNGGGWGDLNVIAGEARVALSPEVVDGVATTQQVGSGFFTAGLFDDVDGAVASINVTTDDETEIEFTIVADSAEATNGDTIEFRVVTTATELIRYISPTATITVGAAAADSIAGDYGAGALASSAQGNYGAGAVAADVTGDFS